jgi:hypothetical protein
MRSPPQGFFSHVNRPAACRLGYHAKTWKAVSLIRSTAPQYRVEGVRTGEHHSVTPDGTHCLAGPRRVISKRRPKTGCRHTSVPPATRRNGADISHPRQPDPSGQSAIARWGCDRAFAHRSGLMRRLCVERGHYLLYVLTLALRAVRRFPAVRRQGLDPVEHMLAIPAAILVSWHKALTFARPARWAPCRLGQRAL